MVTLRPRTWTRAEYEQMLDAGVLTPEDHVELIEGEILVMSPEKSRHSACVDLVGDALRHVFAAGFTVRIQHPLALGLRSEPEPDVAVVHGSPRDYADAHPSTALLVVEVSDSSVDYDRSVKARLYAAAGLPEYWLVNLVEGCIEVRRDPRADGYRSVERHQPPARIAPVAVPAASIPVADLLP